MKFQDLIDDGYRIINSSPTTTILHKNSNNNVVVEDATDNVFTIDDSSGYCELGVQIKSKEELIKYENETNKRIIN